MDVNALNHLSPQTGGLQVLPPEHPHAPFNAVYAQAVKAVEHLAGQFVSTALVYPLLEQASDSPFKTEMFDGGFTEDSFRQRLNVKMADEITTGGGFMVNQALTGRLTDWLKNQPPQVWQRVASFKGVDLNG